MSAVTTFYMKDREKWKKFVEIADREGKNASKILVKFIEDYVSLHDPGNPQTLMSSYSEGGKVTISNIEGRVRQLCIEKSERRGIRWTRILEITQMEGISEVPMRVAMATRVRDWLREKGYKIIQ